MAASSSAFHARATHGDAHISVVTPFHNSAASLERAIESVLGQTFQSWEYILADNCSTDGSGEIAQRYAAKDGRIRFIHYDELIPQGPNYNRALREIGARSGYCKIVQADDFLMPRCLEAMVGLGARHPSVGVIGALREVEREIEPPPDVRLAEVTAGREIGRRTVLREPYVLGSPTSVMYRADLVRERPEFFREGAFFDDTDAALDVLLASDFGFLSEVLTHTSRDPGSTFGRVQSFDLGLLHSFVTAHRIGELLFSADELAAIMPSLVGDYYDQLARSLARRPDRSLYLAFHRSVLDESLGTGPSTAQLLRASTRIGARALARWLRRRPIAAPMR